MASEEQCPILSRNEKNKRVFHKVFGLALILHLVLLPLKFTGTLRLPEQVVQQEQRIPIQLLLEERKEASQVVTNTYQENEARPVDTDFLSERDQFYDRQTVAREVGSYQEAAKGDSEQDNTPQKIQQRQEQTQSKQHEARPSRQDGIRFADLGVEARELSFDAMEVERSVAGTESGRAETSGRARNNDYVEDIPLGDLTQLNTQEYKYYGYYHRIRQRLEQHWGVSLQESAERLYRTGRRLPANTHRITGVTVTMDERGNILDVRVKNESGVIELDNAAVESFNRAGPFPNPPQGMVRNGRVVIDWGFVVKS